METNTSSSNKGIEKYIRDQLRLKDSFEIEDKINFSASIIKSIYLISEVNEFDREEYQLVLIEWICKERHQLKEDNYQGELLRDLLFNIIIIFESIPLSIREITSHRFIEKFMAIRNCIKKLNVSIACRILNLTDYWSRMVNVVKTEALLKKKRERERMDECDFTNEDTDYSITHCKMKKVTWKVDLVDVIEIYLDISNKEDLTE